MARRCNYDPALRKTEHGSRLYQLWKKVRSCPHCEEWEPFQNFYYWAMESGYETGAWLRQIDESVAYCPDNCYWHIPSESNTIPSDWADNWNKTVNRIRKHYGMTPLEGTDYADL